MRRILMTAVLAVCTLAALLTSRTLRASAPAPAEILRVDTLDAAALQSAGFDLLETRGSDYLLVMGDDSVLQALREQGFSASVAHVLDPLPGLLRSDAYYSGYHTVDEHFSHMDAVAAAHPGLVKLIDYGDSWRKANAQADGHDLRAICITHVRAGDCALSPDTDKPRFLLIAAVHARELSTSEMAWRWMDWLTDNDGIEPEVSALLDSSELWVVPVANPDGRQLVELGGNAPYLQRKNANTSQGSCASPPTASNQFGVDLNRNASFKWGVAGGSSTTACDQLYRGLAASSEPEEQALELLMRLLFHDQRDESSPSNAAPGTSTGVLISLHSYSNFVMFPWSWVACGGQPCAAGNRAPNDDGLRALAFRMSYFNGFLTGQSSEILYASSGTTDDYAYGALGVPGFTIEIGPQDGQTCGGFMPAYTCNDSVFWPQILPALRYAAEAARQPYALSRGPTVISATLTPAAAAEGPFDLRARARDDAFGPGVSIPASQNIDRIEYFIGTPPWAGGVARTLSPQDGAYNSPSEIGAATIGGGVPPGRRLLYVRACNTGGQCGPVTALWIVNITPPCTGVWRCARLPLLTGEGRARHARR